MRFLLRACIVLIVALPLLAAAAIALGLQDRPMVVSMATPTAQDIERARRVLDAHDARRPGPGGLHTVRIDERDLGLALDYLAGRYGRGAARVALRPGAATVQATFEVPPNPVGRYLNIDATLRDTGAAPRVDRLRIGRLPVPEFVAAYLWQESLRRLVTTDPARLAAAAVKSASFGDGSLALTYQWSDEMERRARKALVAPEDLPRLRAYQERLAEALERSPRAVSLAALMPPLFRLALERSAGGDPARENRAAIVTLALYTTGQRLQKFVPAAATWRQPARRSVTLAGREDFPKHFLVSAAIAAEAGSPLADAIGVYKEIEDSRGGSGFSFNDIGADRAGTRFGEVATQSPARARELTRAIAAGIAESDVMPDVSDLPEFLPEAEFRRRFGGVDGPGYRKTMAAIDERIAALPLLRR